MKINVYPADLGGCGHYRIIWPAEALISQGADVEIIHGADRPERQIQATYWNGDDGSRTLLDVIEPQCDIVVLQRPLTDVLADSIPILQRRGLRVVVEVDDDFESISPRNVSWHAVRPPTAADSAEERIKHSRRNYMNLRRSCEQADLVVVTTPTLADVYGHHGRVVVVPNCVPELYQWTFAPGHDGVRVGWSGSIDTHPDDLQVTKGAVGRAMRGTGAHFGVIGTGKGVQRMLNLVDVPHAVGWQAIDKYPEAMADLDVGIVPLELSRFNEAKSWLKGLEFAALGVPFVASPTGPYVDLCARGAGVLAERPKDWERMLRRLLTNADERAELAEAGREAAAKLTIEGNCGRWLEAWGAAVNTPVAV